MISVLYIIVYLFILLGNTYFMYNVRSFEVIVQTVNDFSVNRLKNHDRALAKDFFKGCVQVKFADENIEI